MYRVIIVGIGGHGAYWCSNFLPPNIKDGLIQVVAAVDLNPVALEVAKRELGLSDAQCYTDIEKAFKENPAEICINIVPPEYHERVVDLAIAYGLHILSEKPIADTLEASIRIVNKVQASGLKMGVTMSHRFDQDKTTLRNELLSGVHGDLNYLACKYTADYRQYATWGSAFRHEMKDALIIEGAVHHLDILADLAGDVCETIYAETWNPHWGHYKGDSQALIIMKMRNGVRAVYEGANTNAVGLNGWAQEYIRAECEKTTLIMDHREIERFDYDSTATVRELKEGEGQAIPLLEQAKWANIWLIEKFVHWIAGGPPMETNVADNLQSMALIFAAIESSRSGVPVNVQEFLDKARLAVEDFKRNEILGRGLDHSDN